MHGQLEPAQQSGDFLRWLLLGVLEQACGFLEVEVGVSLSCLHQLLKEVAVLLRVAALQLVQSYVD